jgi:hypothetical protein
MFINHLKSVAILILLSIFLIAPVYSNKYFAETVTNVVTNLSENDNVKGFGKELECLTKNIYYEAATESYEGKLAVAQVTLNRVNHPKFPDTVCGVVYQRTSNVCQFSWTCGSKLTINNKYAWEESEIVARKALTQPISHDIIAHTNALYYHASYVNPGWKGKVITKIGNHIFYARI